jgi:hypothetical protein
MVLGNWKPFFSGSGDAGVAAERDRQRRVAGADRAAVRDDDRVGREHLGVLGRVPLFERAAYLLLALDHELDADRRLAVPGAQRPDVDEDVRLRVGRAATVDRAVSLCRLERRRRPERLVTSGDDVVVRVQEDRRRTLRTRDLTRDDRCGALELERDEVLDTDTAEQVDDCLVRLEQRRARVLGNPHSESDGIATRRARSSFSRGMRDATVAASGGRESAGMALLTDNRARGGEARGRAIIPRLRGLPQPGRRGA